jgi:CRP-like cAMP-binding protein
MDNSMDKISQVMRQMIRISDGELEEFLSRVSERTFHRSEILGRPGQVPHQVFFIVKGLVRVTVIDNDGVEHTIHFALENQFIADYSSYILQQPSLYTLQALDETVTIMLPREAIEWGYRHMEEGQKLGRLIAEFYFIYQDNRIKNLYARTPKERYDGITEVFPNIHNRVPQHMIASYLGITPVHLSRLKSKPAHKD